MKIFYTAKSFSGQAKSGELDIKNERDLATQLRSEGYVLTSLKELETDQAHKIKIKLLNRFVGIPLTEKLMFARNLSVMISSGLPLSRAVRNISFQTRNKKLISILNNIFDSLQAGNSFANSLAKYPGVFDDLFVNMIKVGEASGNLEEVLGILATQLEKEHELISKIKGALTYPAVILVAMVGIAIIMLTYILPKLTSVFTDMEITLPASTRIVIAISDALRNHSILVGMILFFSLLLGRFFFMMPVGKKIISFLAINTPLVRNLVVKVNCARFSRIYSSLLKSGVSALESLKILSETLTNYYYKSVLKNGIEQIQKGENLSKIIASNTKVFPILVSQMIQVGEETGKTEMVLLKLAEFYETEVSQISKNMSSIIEPILMIFIGSAVGFFAVSMLQPMYSIMDNIK